MLSVGLTGNVAAGKSSVLSLLKGFGATVIDADQLVRRVQQPGSHTLQTLADRFGADILLPDGHLHRPTLRRRVMGDPAALSALNAIVHPAVEQLHRDELAAAKARGDRVVVSDIPLLFEAGWESEFDLIVLVDAPRNVRRSRLITLRALTEEEADRLLASQAPAVDKRARSDVVIDNDGSWEILARRVRALWSTLDARARGQSA